MAPRGNRRGPRELRRALRKVRQAPLRVPGATRSRFPWPPSQRGSTPLQVCTAASRSRGADARMDDERPSWLREPPHNSLDAFSLRSSSRLSPRAVPPLRCDDCPATAAARAMRRASPPAPGASPSQDHGRLPRVPRRSPNLRPAAVDCPASPARTERGATCFPRGARRFPRLARQSPGRSRSVPRASRRPPGSLSRTPGSSPRARSASRRRSRSAYFTMKETISLQFCSPVDRSAWKRK